MSADLTRHVRGIERARREIRVSEARIEGFVQEMRAAGGTWGDVARALGVTRQAARQKYGSQELDFTGAR